jgi:hypothetical protein
MNTTTLAALQLFGNLDKKEQSEVLHSESCRLGFQAALVDDGFSRADAYRVVQQLVQRISEAR